MTTPHPVRPGREQARRAGPCRRPVLAAGVQHHSLAVGPTDDERVSRMTIVVDGAHAGRPGDKQLDKLIRVLKVIELHEGDAVERELALIKVRIEPALRGELLEVAGVFRATSSTWPGDADARGQPAARGSWTRCCERWSPTGPARSSAPAGSRCRGASAGIRDRRGPVAEDA